jgi:hypothetical protein
VGIWYQPLKRLNLQISFFNADHRIPIFYQWPLCGHCVATVWPLCGHCVATGIDYKLQNVYACNATCQRHLLPREDRGFVELESDTASGTVRQCLGSSSIRLKWCLRDSATAEWTSRTSETESFQTKRGPCLACIRLHQAPVQSLALQPTELAFRRCPGFGRQQEHRFGRRWIAIILHHSSAAPPLPPHT